MAGTLEKTSNKVLMYGDNSVPIAREVLYSWVGDASDGSVPTLSVLSFSGWWITKIITNPGSTAPTALYDITLVEVDGNDLADGALLDRSASATEVEALAAQIGINGFAITVANQSVHSAAGTIRIFLNR